MTKKKIVFINIADGTETDRFLLSQRLRKMSDDYNFIIAPKEIKLWSIDDIILTLQKLKETE